MTDMEQRLLVENLPIAEPLDPEPNTFEELIALAADLFRISNLVEHVASPWPVAGVTLFDD